MLKTKRKYIWSTIHDEENPENENFWVVREEEKFAISNESVGTFASENLSVDRKVSASTRKKFSITISINYLLCIKVVFTYFAFLNVYASYLQLVYPLPCSAEHKSSDKFYIR